LLCSNSNAALLLPKFGYSTKIVTHVYRFLNIFIQFYDAVTLATPAMQIVIRLELIIIIIRIIIIIILILIIIILT
jgi:hypothetical protein